MNVGTWELTRGGSAGRWLRRGLLAFDWLSEVTLVFGMVTMTVVVLAGVISRYVFNAAFTWTDELASWIFVWLILVGVPYGYRQGRHIAFDLAQRLSGTRLRHLLAAVEDYVVVYVSIMMIAGGAILIDRVGGLSGGLQWPSYLKYVLVPFCGAMLLAYQILMSLEDPRRLARGGVALGLALLTYLLTSVAGLVPFPGVSPSLLMVIAFAIPLVLSVPVVFAIAFAVFATTWTDESMLPPAAIMQNMVAGANRFILLAIPFFLLTSYLMNIGGVTTRLIDFATSLVGHLRGGLAQANVVNSALIGGISGSSAADAASTSKILVPEMIRRGYPPAFACATTAASSIVPNIIPPAISMLVYASIADASIARLFVGGVVPGILITLAMMVVVYLSARWRGFETKQPRLPLPQIFRAFGRAVPSLGLAVAIIGTIRFGIVTPTEAAVIAVLWALGLGTIVYRAYNLRTLYRTLVDAALDTALIGFLIGVTVPFAWVLIAEQLPQHILASSLSTFGSSPGIVILLVIGALLVTGTFLDGSAGMLIVVPLFLPLALSLGFDPIHFGIVVIITMMLGGLTPPFGIFVFITASITRLPVGGIFRECVPFLIAALIILLLIAFVPSLVLGLWSILE